MLLSTFTAGPSTGRPPFSARIAIDVLIGPWASSRSMAAIRLCRPLIFAMMI